MRENLAQYLLVKEKSCLTLIIPGYFQNNLSRRGAQSSSLLKSAVSAIFSHTKQQKTFQGALGTQDHRVQDQPWSFNGPYRAPNMDLMIFEKNFGNFEKILGFSIFDIL